MDWTFYSLDRTPKIEYGKKLNRGGMMVEEKTPFKEAVGITRLSKALEQLNQLPDEFWLSYAGETLYLDLSTTPPTVLCHGSLGEVLDFAKKMPRAGLVFPVPSKEQLLSATAEKRGLLD